MAKSQSRLITWICALGMVACVVIAWATGNVQRQPTFTYATPDDTFTPDAIATKMDCAQFRRRADCLYHNWWVGDKK